MKEINVDFIEKTKDGLVKKNFSTKMELVSGLDATIEALRGEIAQAGKVDSVNGKTGTVVLGAQDINFSGVNSVKTVVDKKADKTYVDEGFIGKEKNLGRHSFDSVKDTGIYAIWDNSTSPDKTNADYILEVIKDAKSTKVIQRAYLPSASAGLRFWQRMNTGTTWSDWEEMATKKSVDELFQSGVESNKTLVDALNSKGVKASTDDTIKVNTGKVKDINVKTYDVDDIVHMQNLEMMYNGNRMTETLKDVFTPSEIEDGSTISRMHAIPLMNPSSSVIYGDAIAIARLGGNSDAKHHLAIVWTSGFVSDLKVKVSLPSSTSALFPASDDESCFFVTNVKDSKLIKMNSKGNTVWSKTFTKGVVPGKETASAILAEPIAGDKVVVINGTNVYLVRQSDGSTIKKKTNFDDGYATVSISGMGGDAIAVTCMDSMGTYKGRYQLIDKEIEERIVFRDVVTALTHHYMHFRGLTGGRGLMTQSMTDILGNTTYTMGLLDLTKDSLPGMYLTNNKASTMSQICWDKFQHRGYLLLENGGKKDLCLFSGYPVAMYHTESTDSKKVFLSPYPSRDNKRRFVMTEDFEFRMVSNALGMVGAKLLEPTNTQNIH